MLHIYLNFHYRDNTEITNVRLNIREHFQFVYIGARIGQKN